jgi:hypothetical protein
MPRTTPALQGFPRAIHIRVAIDSVDGGFEDKLVNHAATARTIEDDDAENAAIHQVLGFSRSTLGPGGSCGLRKR